MQKVALYVQALDLSKAWLEKKVENPQTGRTVKVKSLPPELQAQYRPKSHEKAIHNDINNKIKKSKDKTIKHHNLVKKLIQQHDSKTADQDTSDIEHKIYHHLGRMVRHLSNMNNHLPYTENNKETRSNILKTRDSAESLQGSGQKHQFTNENRRNLDNLMKTFKSFNHKNK